MGTFFVVFAFFSVYYFALCYLFENIFSAFFCLKDNHDIAFFLTFIFIVIFARLVPYIDCMKLQQCVWQELAHVLDVYDDVREIRLRDFGKVKLNVGGVWYYLQGDKLVLDGKFADNVGQVCGNVIANACNGSLYAYEKTLSKGYFTLQDGTRFGVCGTLSQQGVFQTYTSLCVRIPHCVACATKQMCNAAVVGNTVVIGPPSSGKTTLLRDMATKLSANFNVLVVDERGEIFFDSVERGCCDVLARADKSYAFGVAIRSLAPDIIICDELSPDDTDNVKIALGAGVKLTCSVHGQSVQDFANKFSFAKYFAKAIVIESVGRYSVVDLR